MEAIQRAGCVDASVADSLTLSMLPGIGPRILTVLLDHFGSAHRVLLADDAELASVRGIGPQLVHRIRTARDFVDVESILQWCAENDTRIVCRDWQGYPRMLDELPDAPPILFLRGQLLPDDAIAVAIVGTRHATTYGLKQCERFAYSLARAGVTVVSGLARGIDAVAHRAALDAGGRTVAVLGSGMGKIYPPEHVGLASEIARSGGVISEFAPAAKPRSGMFPQRNRLISGLSLATLIVEAPDRSGALITARLAAEQNRDVMAVPGPISSRASRGCNQLIREGATLVQTADDILEQLGPIGRTITTSAGRDVRNGSELSLNEVERGVLDAIDTTSTSIDQVIAKSQLPAQRVMAVISVLEVRRLVRRLSGQYVSRI